MLRTWKLPTQPLICTVDPPEGDPAGGGGGGETGGSGGAPTGVPQSEVDRIVKGRVEETRKSTLQKVQDELGVDLETAKQLIADSKKRAEDEKSDAQKARDAADAEKTAAEKEKSEAARERHDNRVERQLLRVAPMFEDTKDKTADQQLDAWVTRVARLVNAEVEVGDDADKISEAIKTLKADMPELFGAAKKEEGEGGDPPPPSDPKGGPPKGPKGQEDAYTRGLERAKQVAAQSTYPILQSSTS